MLGERTTKLTIPELADRAGVSVPTVYRNFPTREALLTEVAAEMSRRFGAPTPVGDVNAFVAALPTFCAYFAIEQHVGVKDVAIRAAEHGMTETAVDEADRSRPCLDAEYLAALEGLAARCESAVPGAPDIEWAFVGRRLFLLQRRDVTR